MALLGASHPLQSMDTSISNQMHTIKISAAQMISGIVAYAKDRLVLFGCRLL